MHGAMPIIAVKFERFHEKNKCLRNILLQLDIIAYHIALTVQFSEIISIEIDTQFSAAATDRRQPYLICPRCRDFVGVPILPVGADNTVRILDQNGQCLVGILRHSGFEVLGGHTNGKGEQGCRIIIGNLEYQPVRIVRIGIRLKRGLEVEGRDGIDTDIAGQSVGPILQKDFPRFQIVGNRPVQIDQKPENPWCLTCLDLQGGIGVGNIFVRKPCNGKVICVDIRIGKTVFEEAELNDSPLLLLRLFLENLASPFGTCAVSMPNNST